MSALATAKQKREAYLAEIRRDKANLLSEILDGIKALNDMGGLGLNIEDETKEYKFSLKIGLYDPDKRPEVAALLREVAPEAPEEPEVEVQNFAQAPAQGQARRQRNGAPAQQ
jgi:hypothetical protein